MKRMNRVRSSVSTGNVATLRRASTSASSDCGLPPFSHATVHRTMTHCGVIDSQRHPRNGPVAYPSSDCEFSSRSPTAALNVVVSGQASTYAVGRCRRTPPHMMRSATLDEGTVNAFVNHHQPLSSSTAAAVTGGSALDSRIIGPRPRSRQASGSSASAVTGSNFNDVIVVRAVTPSSLSTAATMPDIVSRTLSIDEQLSNDATCCPTAMVPPMSADDGDRTPTNDRKIQQAPLFAAYCHRQRQIEAGSAAFDPVRAGSNWFPTDQSGSGLQQRLTPVGVCPTSCGSRPSAKVLPSPKPQACVNGSNYGQSSDYFRPTTPVEGYYRDGTVTNSANYSTYGTLPRKKLLPATRFENRRDVDGAKYRPEVMADVGQCDRPAFAAVPATATPSTSAKSDFDAVGASDGGRVSASLYQRPSSGTAASSSRKQQPKPAPPKRTNSFKTETATTSSNIATAADDERSNDVNKSSNIRRNLPSGSVSGVRRQDGECTAGDHVDRRGELTTPTAAALRPGNWPDNNSTNAKPGAEAQPQDVANRQTHTANDRSDTGCRVVSSGSSSQAVMRQESTDSSCSSGDPTPDGVMPFANEEVGTIKLHRTGVGGMGNVATGNADSEKSTKRVTWRQCDDVVGNGDGDDVMKRLENKLQNAPEDHNLRNCRSKDSWLVDNFAS